PNLTAKWNNQNGIDSLADITRVQRNYKEPNGAKVDFPSIAVQISPRRGDALWLVKVHRMFFSLDILRTLIRSPTWGRQSCRQARLLAGLGAEWSFTRSRE